MDLFEQRKQFILNQFDMEKSKQKRFYYLQDLILLDKFYQYMGMPTIFPSIENRMTYFDYQRLQKESHKILQNFINLYIKDHAFHQMFSNNVLYYEGKIEQPFLCKYSKTRFSFQEVKEIVLSFFKECFPMYHAFVEDIFKRQNIYQIPQNLRRDENYLGYCFYLYSTNEVMILLPSQIDFEFLVTLVHELGHAISYSMLNTAFFAMDKGPFYEVFPYTLERIFLSYLEKKHLYLEDIVLYLHNLNNTLFQDAEKVLFATRIDALAINSAYEITNQEKEILEHPVMVENNGVIHLKNSLIYFYADLLSLEYVNQYHWNKEKMLFHIKELNTGNGIFGIEELFPMAGLDVEELSHLKSLKKHLTLLQKKTNALK